MTRPRRARRRARGQRKERRRQASTRGGCGGRRRPLRGAVEGKAAAAATATAAEARPEAVGDGVVARGRVTKAATAPNARPSRRSQVVWRECRGVRSAFTRQSHRRTSASLETPASPNRTRLGLASWPLGCLASSRPQHTTVSRHVLPKAMTRRAAAATAVGRARTAVVQL